MGLISGITLLFGDRNLYEIPAQGQSVSVNISNVPVSGSKQHHTIEIEWHFLGPSD
jgi:hypothetical protein